MRQTLRSTPIDRHPIDSPLPHPNFARGERSETHNSVEQRALSGPIRTEQHGDLARLNCEVDIATNRQRTALDGEPPKFKTNGHCAISVPR